VLTWELPGHGTDSDPIPPGLTIADLADRVLGVVDGPFLYAGDSVGGQVGLELLLEAPDRVSGAVLCCTGAKIGDAGLWQQRIADVRASGTAGLVMGSAQRWFGPSFLDREPERASALLHSLRDASDDGYVAVCEALADYDVRARLGEITAPVVAVAGATDPVCPPDVLREIAEGVRAGRLVVLDDVGHQAPAERPDQVAHLIRQLAEETS
jgi:pimeloyl-ACP methyl ester carboxylesterase